MIKGPLSEGYRIVTWDRKLSIQWKPATIRTILYSQLAADTSGAEQKPSVLVNVIPKSFCKKILCNLLSFPVFSSRVHATQTSLALVETVAAGTDGFSAADPAGFVRFFHGKYILCTLSYGDARKGHAGGQARSTMTGDKNHGRNRAELMVPRKIVGLK